MLGDSRRSWNGCFAYLVKLGGFDLEATTDHLGSGRWPSRYERTENAKASPCLDRGWIPGSRKPRAISAGRVRNRDSIDNIPFARPDVELLLSLP